MATDVAIGGSGSGEIFIGEDKTLSFEILDSDDDPVNMAGWDVLFDVRAKDNSEGTALITKTATILGTFNADRTLNAQRAEIELTDDDLLATVFKGSNLPSGAKTYRYSLKRMTSGQETVLARGDFSPEKATAP